VDDRRPFVAAAEGDGDGDFGVDESALRLRPVRFHEGHFRPRIRGKVYIRADDTTSAAVEREARAS
jgi:hypothetical protein